MGLLVPPLFSKQRNIFSRHLFSTNPILGVVLDTLQYLITKLLMKYDLFFFFFLSQTVQ